MPGDRTRRFQEPPRQAKTDYYGTTPDVRRVIGTVSHDIPVPEKTTLATCFFMDEDAGNQTRQ